MKKLIEILTAGVIAGACAMQMINKALESLMDEDHIYPMDTLDQGNALSVLALVKADKKDRAGRVLKAVTDRAALKGSFAVQQPGVKSAFDPSVFLGTLGVGKAMCKYAALC